MLENLIGKKFGRLTVIESVGSLKNLRFIFPIIFRQQKHRLNTNTARKKTKKVDIGGRVIAAEVCM